MTSTSSSGAKPIVLAYSGGLDTSFLVPWVAENTGRPVITVTVDTGGIDAAAAKTLHERALALGAIAHHQVDARADYFEQVLRFLIMGNVRRGQMYPLCVGAERVMQAHQHDCPRLHGRGQRPGALRSGAAHAGTGP
jgi:argininosuccinate synthase